MPICNLTPAIHFPIQMNEKNAYFGRNHENTEMNQAGVYSLDMYRVYSKIPSGIVLSELGPIWVP